MSLARHVATLAACSGAAVALARPALAQNPVRLPGVSVTAPMTRPGPRAMAGIVRDTSAIPIEGVEISIVDLKRIATTDAEGHFRLIDIKPGTYNVRARRLGYLPQVRKVTVDDRGGLGEFELVPFGRSLPTVFVNASASGLSGVVGDTAYHLLPQTTVRVLGEGLVQATDSAGEFYFDVKPGEYVVSAEREGYGSKVVSVRVPEDSGRRVTMVLQPQKLGVQSAHNIEDFGKRLAWTMPTKFSFFTHDDLVRMDVTFVTDIVQAGYTRIATRVTAVDKDCWAVKNGGPDVVNMKGLTIDEVEDLEIYLPGLPALRKERTMSIQNASGKLLSSQVLSMDHGRAGAGNEREAHDLNVGKSCPTIYVWLR